MRKELQKKVDFAIHLLQSIPNKGDIELSYSGGKDSDVILELAKMSGIPFRAIYKNTTIDPPKTIEHVKNMGVEIINPKETFFKIVERKGVPTMRARFCCEKLKEYKVLDVAIQGIRRSESAKRMKNYKEPEMCRTYPKGEKVRVYYPILEWSQQDVEEFIQERDIKCHPLYYDEDGKFHVERRLGCIGCPMRSDRGKNDFLKYPKFLKKLIRSCQTFLDTHPKCSSHKKFGNAYNIMFHDIFCDSYEQYLTRTTGGLFPDTAINAKEFLEDYFNIDL